MNRRAVVWLGILAVVPVCLATLRDQSIAVKGTLMCGNAPATKIRVKLWDEDGGPDPDDLLDQGYTDERGMFSLSGGTAEMTPIDPIFKVYHDCDDGKKPGHRKVRFRLPGSYITEGRVPKKTFDIGTINLETIFAVEGREMLISRMRRHQKHYHHQEQALHDDMVELLHGV